MTKPSRKQRLSVYLDPAVMNRLAGVPRGAIIRDRWWRKRRSNSSSRPMPPKDRKRRSPNGSTSSIVA